VTPTSYLELLTLIKSLISKRSEEVLTQIDRYDNGLEKLKTTEITVQEM
jgi:hypothetical protein